MPYAAHDNDPAVALAVENSLGDVDESGKGVEDREEVGGGSVRADVPDHVGVLEI